MLYRAGIYRIFRSFIVGSFEAHKPNLPGRFSPRMPTDGHFTANQVQWVEPPAPCAYNVSARPEITRSGRLVGSSDIPAIVFM
jgi:hypothetical protein